MSHRERVLWVLLVSMTVFASPAASTTVSGTVRGAAKKPLQGVEVTVTNADTGATLTAASGSAGDFSIDGLEAGTYHLTAELPGYSALTLEALTVDNDEPAKVDLTLTKEFTEVITVTARKREERLIDVPISVSTVSATDIEEQAIATLLESAETLPNVVVESTNSSFPGITIRGITNSNALGFEPAVGVYLDETYLPQPGAVDKLLIDIERIEVMRGPQGTEWGKNTIGGVVNLVTAKPSSEMKASLELAAGTFDLRQVRGSVGGALAGDSLSGRLAFGLQNRDGWMENRTEGSPDLMSEDTTAARAQLLFTPSTSATVLVSADSSDNDDLQNVPDITGGPLYLVDGRDGTDRSVALNEETFNHREVKGASVRADVTLSRFLLTSLTGYRAFDFENFQDQDVTVLDLASTGTREEIDYFSQEVRISSTSGRSFSLLGGLFYADRSHTNRFSAQLGTDVPPLFGLPPLPGYQESVETVGSIDEQSLAGFFSGTWTLGDRATLELGLRLSDEEKDLAYRQTVFPFFLAPGFPVGIVYGLAADVAPLTDSRSDTEPSGALSLVYSFRPELNGYVRLARGFKAGGFSTGLAPVSDPDERGFDEETVDAYEIGLKSLLAKRRLNLNAALFYLDYRDKQEQVWTGSQFLVRNAAEATSKGLELELSATPVSGLETRLALGYTDATYDRFADPLLGDFSGNRLLDAPKWTGSLVVQYYRPLTQATTWFLGGQASYRDDNYKTFDNDPRFEQQAHTLVNARLGVQFQHGRYSLAVWGKNLTNEDYLLGGFEFLGTTYAFLNVPRSYGVELRLHLE